MFPLINLVGKRSRGHGLEPSGSHKLTCYYCVIDSFTENLNANLSTWSKCSHFKRIQSIPIQRGHCEYVFPCFHLRWLCPFLCIHWIICDVVFRMQPIIWCVPCKHDCSTHLWGYVEILRRVWFCNERLNLTHCSPVTTYGEIDLRGHWLR